jgi:hypothetical protein
VADPIAPGTARSEDRAALPKKDDEVDGITSAGEIDAVGP